MWFTKLFVCLALTTLTPSAPGQEQNKDPNGPFHNFVADDWEIITPGQWSRKVTVSGGNAIITVGIMMNGDIIFKVFRPCQTPNEAHILAWQMGSPIGYSLDCKMNPSISETPSLWEDAAGALPKEVVYMLKWGKSHHKQNRSSLV